MPPIYGSGYVTDTSTTDDSLPNRLNCGNLIEGIIAGGPKAIHAAVEGAEDSIVDGMSAIDEKDITENDVVVGKHLKSITFLIMVGNSRNRRLWSHTLRLGCSVRSNASEGLHLSAMLQPEH